MARGSLAVGVMTAVAAAFSWTMGVAETPRQEVALPTWLVGLELRPTYTEGVGLVFDRRCSGCHREGGLGPMSLASLEDLREWSVGTQTPMKDAITLRLMPPWPADPAVGFFSNDARLTEVELDLLERFIEAGYARGEGEYEPSAQWFDEWSMGRPDAVFELPGYTLGEEVENEVVEVVVRTNFPEDRWIAAAEAIPGAADPLSFPAHRS